MKTKKIGRSKSSKSCLILSDMHIGDLYAPCTKDATNQSFCLKPNEFNQKMYDNWCMIRDMREKKDTDILLLNGEPITGSYIKTAGGGVWSTNIQDQLDDAERLIRMYNWREILLTRGSRYHVTVQNMYHEEVLARKLGAVPYRGIFGQGLNNRGEDKAFQNGVSPYGQYTDFYAWFVLGDKFFSACHHVGYSKNELYRTTAIGREGLLLELAKGKWYPSDMEIDVIARSHVHYRVIVKYRSWAFTTPCWKLPDEYMVRHGLGGSAVDIGSMEIIVEPNGKIEVIDHVITTKDYPKPQIINFDKILREKHGIS